MAAARLRAFVLRMLGAAVSIAVACLALLPGDTDRGLAAVADPYQVLAVQTSADLSQRLTAVPAPEFQTVAPAHLPVINVNAAIRYQTVQGFGAAMTDSSAWLIERGLSQTARDTLMSELFGASGIDIDFVKVPMGASDFTHNGQPYTYDDLPTGPLGPDAGALFDRPRPGLHTAGAARGAIPRSDDGVRGHAVDSAGVDEGEPLAR